VESMHQGSFLGHALHIQLSSACTQNSDLHQTLGMQVLLVLINHGSIQFDPRSRMAQPLAYMKFIRFSPTDTLPLTRRAKLFMLLQSTISIVTLTAIAGAATNILAGGS